MNPFKWFRSKASISAIVGGKTYHIDPSHPSFSKIKIAINTNNEQEFITLMDIPLAVNTYSQGAISIVGDRVFYHGTEIKNSLTDRILSAMRDGIPFTPFMAFLNNLLQNPSKRAINELYSWLNNQDIPITVDGYWLGYKAIKSDWTDKHTGTVVNTIGSTPEMPRSEVDDDFGVACSEGYHVGNESYVRSFGESGDHFIIVKVNPKDVVSVPAGETTKCRVSRYQVISTWETMTAFAWPVYYAPGPNQSILPVAGINKLHKERPPEVEEQEHDNDEHEYQDKEFWNTLIVLRTKLTSKIMEAIEGIDGSFGDLDISIFREHDYYDVLVAKGFVSQDESDEFSSKAQALKTVWDTYSCCEVDEDGEALDPADLDIEAPDLDGLLHLDVTQRYNLRQEAINALMAADSSLTRVDAETRIEALTRRNMADILPENDQAKYLDPNYKPPVVDITISFDLYNGDSLVSHNHVQTTQEEGMILQMAQLIYPHVEQRNRTGPSQE